MKSIKPLVAELLKSGKAETVFVAAGPEGTKYVDVRIYPPEGDRKEFDETVAEVVGGEG